MTEDRDVDELFGIGGEPGPQVWTAGLLLGAGLVVAIVAAACTSVPGALLVLAGWSLVEQDLARIEAGFLPERHRRTLRRLQIGAWVAVAVVNALLVVEGLMFAFGIYQDQWSQFFAWLRGDG